MMIGFLMIVPIFFALAQFSFTRNLMLKYPDTFTMGGFTKAGPTEEMMKKSSYSFTFYSKGYLKSRIDSKDTDAIENLKKEAPDCQVVPRVTGGDPGYDRMRSYLAFWGSSEEGCANNGHCFPWNEFDR